METNSSEGIDLEFGANFRIMINRFFRERVARNQQTIQKIWREAVNAAEGITPLSERNIRLPRLAARFRLAGEERLADSLISRATTEFEPGCPPFIKSMILACAAKICLQENRVPEALAFLAEAKIDALQARDAPVRAIHLGRVAELLVAAGDQGGAAEIATFLESQTDPAQPPFFNYVLHEQATLISLRLGDRTARDKVLDSLSDPNERALFNVRVATFYADIGDTANFRLFAETVERTVTAADSIWPMLLLKLLQIEDFGRATRLFMRSLEVSEPSPTYCPISLLANLSSTCGSLHRRVLSPKARNLVINSLKRSEVETRDDTIRGQIAEALAALDRPHESHACLRRIRQAVLHTRTVRSIAAERIRSGRFAEVFKYASSMSEESHRLCVVVDVACEIDAGFRDLKSVLKSVIRINEQSGKA